MTNLRMLGKPRGALGAKVGEVAKTQLPLIIVIA